MEKAKGIMEEKYEENVESISMEKDMLAMIEAANSLCTSVLKLSPKKYPIVLPIVDSKSFIEMTAFVFKSFENVHRQMVSFQDEVHVLQQKVTQSELAKDRMKKEHDEKETSLQQTTNLCDKKDKEIDVLRKDMSVKEEAIAKYQKQSKISDDNMQKLKSCVDNLETTVEDLKEENCNIKERENKLRREYDERTKEVRNYEQLIKTLKQKANEFEGNTKSAAIQTVSNRGDEEMDQLKSNIKQLEMTKAKLREDIEKLRQREIDLKSKCEKSEANLSELQKSIENREMEGTKIQLVLRSVEIQTVQTERSLRDEEMGRLKTRIDDLLVDQKQLREENLELKEREKDLNTKFERSEAQFCQLQHNIESQKRERTENELSMRSVEIQTERSLRDEEMGRLKTRIDDLLVDQKQLREENLELKEREKDLNTKFERSEAQFCQLQHNIESRKKERTENELSMRSVEIQTESAKSLVQNLETEKKKEKEEYVRKLTIKEQEVSDYQNKIQALNKELQRREEDALKTAIKHKSDNEERDRWFDDIEKVNRKMEAERNIAQKNNEETQKALVRNIIDNKKKNGILERLQTVVQNLEDEKKSALEREKDINRQLQFAKVEVESRCNQISEMEKVVSSLKTEKDDLQTRLSSFAGDKLTRGNPSITDLADPNRPIKIGERYGELYDNQWTDAMEKVDDIKKYFPDIKIDAEEIIIHYLHRIVRSCYQRCLRKAARQIEEIAIIIGMNSVGEQTKEATADAELNSFSGLLAYRNRNAKAYSKRFAHEKAFCDTLLDEWEYQFKHEEVTKKLVSSPFYEKCVELCWCMAIQDPVMCIDDEIQTGTVMDKNSYREFTKSGEKVTYVVWPALYLHKDGPVLYKGVAQVE